LAVLLRPSERPGRLLGPRQLHHLPAVLQLVRRARLGLLRGLSRPLGWQPAASARVALFRRIEAEGARDGPPRGVAQDPARHVDARGVAPGAAARVAHGDALAAERRQADEHALVEVADRGLAEVHELDAPVGLAVDAHARHHEARIEIAAELVD